MIRSTLSAALAATLLLAGCSDDTVQPSDGPDIVASPVEGADDPAIELLTGEPDVGQWFYNADVTEDYGPRATFGQPNTDGVFTLACDGATGELVAWVRVPLLSASLDTRIFLYHGNAGATDQQDPGGVFGDFTSVHHLADDPTAVSP